MTMKPPELSIVVPCYNEALCLKGTNAALLAVLSHLVEDEAIGPNSKILYVDDGSTDGSWELIHGLTVEHVQVSGIKLSRNRGHQNALLAGLFSATGDIIVSIDADLQDDVDVIAKMVAANREGNDIVYGVRDDRTTDTFFKRQTAQIFYSSMSKLGVKVVYNHADFRLMSRRAVDALAEFREVNLFLRGLVPLVGFPSTSVHYRRRIRNAGESKYSLLRMAALAWDGVTSMSSLPLHLVTITGVLVFSATLLMSLVVVIIRLFTNSAVPGWASTVLPIYLLGGLQILCLGIVGEYLGKLYEEVKARPRFIIEQSCGLATRDEKK